MKDDQILCHWGILGMKWGVRRYQNKDGTLTEAGKKREQAERLKNAAKKKENRMDEEAVMDVNRWVKDDIKSTREAVNSTSDVVRNVKDLNRELSSLKKTKRKRMDLTNMTDKEMRDRINREMLERQYDDLFNDEGAKKRGRINVERALDIGGTVLALTSSALSIALALKG